MKYGAVPGLDKQISRLVQGTVPVSSKKKDESFALLDGVLEAGGNAFDTAHIYGGGDPERVFGEWLKDRGARGRVVILAKGCHHNQDRKRVTPHDIAADLHDSLARMQVEYVDLYVLHRDDPSVPVGPIVEALNHWKSEGLIRAFGGSNWSWERIREANEYAAQRGITPFACASPNFSLADQVQEPWAECLTISGPRNEEARDWYREQNLPIFAWSSLAGGFFSGRITRENKQSFEEYYMKLAVDCYASEENFRRLDRAKELAEGRGKSVTQIALAWVMSQPLNLFALVGCNTPEEYRANAEALEIELTARELDYLDLRADSPS
jgi:aryl-alcohol dehydrogenase-like predicted oxidoreductase